MSLSYPAHRPKLQPALRAVLVGRARLALAEIAAHGADSRVHELRKRSKEVRGLLRLLRGGWDGARDWNARIRAATASLAPARDAQVMLATFDTLTATRRAPAEFDELRNLLLDEIAICQQAAVEDAIAEFGTVMRDFAQAADDMRIDGHTPSLVWRNLGRGWAKGQAAHTDATDAGDDAAAFHDWRKRVKQHWYQARFFKPIDRARLRPHIVQVDQLGAVLGDHNDLDVLHLYLRANAPGSHALERLTPDLVAARRRLARQALRMGAGLYALPDPAPDWAHTWKTWRADRPGA
jgi:CHAD domain-containing protein